MVQTLVQLVLNQIDFLALNARQKLLVQLFKLKKKKKSPLKEYGMRNECVERVAREQGGRGS